MFALGEVDISGRILDCSAGTAGFVATARQRGWRAIAVDPAYALPRSDLAEAGRVDLDRGNDIAASYPDRFVWDWYGDPARRLQLRQRALATFVTDITIHRGHYVAGQLPNLPFRDQAFDLALCSHLLFTWADQLGPAWHVAALLELARIARQVRVFPTVMQGAGDPVPFWDELMETLSAAGLRTELHQVPYEFQRGASQLLVAEWVA